MRAKKDTTKSAVDVEEAEKKSKPRGKAFGHLTLEQVVEALNLKNGLISLAAKHLKVSPQAIYKWRDKDLEVRQAIQDARSEIVDAAEHGLRGAVIKGEAWAVCFALKTLGKDRGYVERIEQTGKNGEPASTSTTIILNFTNRKDGGSK